MSLFVKLLNSYSGDMAAFFAAKSAASFPDIPMCAGVYKSFAFLSLVRLSLTRRIRGSRELFCFKALREDRLSVHISSFCDLFFRINACSIAVSSEVKTDVKWGSIPASKTSEFSLTMAKAFEELVLDPSLYRIVKFLLLS